MVRIPEVLAIIPARGGSKSIPRKNIRNFAGFPLIAWSIAAAKQSKLVTRIIVSTDDPQIAEIARQFGAETPFLRPSEFAQDQTPDLPVFTHALNWLKENENYIPDIVVQVRPTSPIRPQGLIDKAIKTLIDHPSADSVRGVVPAGQNPHKMWRLKNEHSPMKNLLDVKDLEEPYNAPRQILPPIYWQTGHIDAIRTKTFSKNTISGKKIYPLIIDPRFSVDIDNEQDWSYFEHLVQTAGLDMVWIEKARRPIPKPVKLIVADFDGVITDNHVWTNQKGLEMVASSRSDSLKIPDLKKQGIEVVIFSSERNPVVAARARKMGIESVQGIDILSKGQAFKKLLAKRKIAAQSVIYIGNDINDLPCFEIAGWGVAVADAYPQVLQAADHILTHCGGNGALRELSELVLSAS